MTPQSHTGFAVGAHYCIGAPLARLEGEAAFGTLFRRVNTLTLASDELTYMPMVIDRAWERLPVVLTSTMAGGILVTEHP